MLQTLDHYLFTKIPLNVFKRFRLWIITCSQKSRSTFLNASDSGSFISSVKVPFNVAIPGKSVVTPTSLLFPSVRVWETEQRSVYSKNYLCLEQKLKTESGEIKSSYDFDFPKKSFYMVQRDHLIFIVWDIFVQNCKAPPSRWWKNIHLFMKSLMKVIHDRF